MDADVIVIGAGAAGVAAARTLSAASRRVIVLEARDRIGGRVYTDYNFGPFPVERGAEFLHGRNSRGRELARELGLTHVEALSIRKIHTAIDGRVRHVLSWFLTTPASWSFLATLFSMWRLSADGKAPDASLAEVAAEASPEVRLLVEAICNSAGTDAHALSTREVGRIMRHGEETEGDFRVREGYGRLIESLARGLDVRLSTPAHVIEWSEREVRVDALRARAAVITLPISLLQGGALRFVPELPPQKLAAIEALKMAPALKVLLRFRERFWPEDASALLMEGAPPVVWPPQKGEPLLIAFATGSRAVALAGDPITRTLETLSRAFGRDIAGLLTASDVMDWTAEPWTRGGYSSVPPHVSGAREQLAVPVRSLHFAGEATDLIGPATVSGALRSGERAAREILER